MQNEFRKHLIVNLGKKEASHTEGNLRRALQDAKIESWEENGVSEDILLRLLELFRSEGEQGVLNFFTNLNNAPHPVPGQFRVGPKAASNIIEALKKML